MTRVWCVKLIESRGYLMSLTQKSITSRRLSHGSFFLGQTLWFGRISLPLMKKILPDSVLESFNKVGEKIEDIVIEDNNVNGRRLCCICGPIPFMQEAKR